MLNFLMITGVTCVIVAIVGGGVKIGSAEFKDISSLWRQLLLAVFGSVLVCSGYAMQQQISPTPSISVGSPSTGGTDANAAMVPADNATKPPREPTATVDPGAAQGPQPSGPNSTAQAASDPGNQAGGNGPPPLNKQAIEQQLNHIRFNSQHQPEAVKK
jgi:hypothetical protein